MNVVYLIQAEETTRYKIGTTENIDARINQLKTGCPYELKLIKTIDGSAWIEHGIHEHFKHCRRKGEWFEFENIESVITYMDEVKSLEESEEDKWFEHKQYLIKRIGGDKEHEAIYKHNMKLIGSGRSNSYLQRNWRSDDHVERGISDLLELAIYNIKLGCYEESIDNIMEYFAHMHGRSSNTYRVSRGYLPGINDYFYDEQMKFKKLQTKKES